MSDTRRRGFLMEVEEGVYVADFDRPGEVMRPRSQLTRSDRIVGQWGSTMAQEDGRNGAVGELVLHRFIVARSRFPRA